MSSRIIRSSNDEPRKIRSFQFTPLSRPAEQKAPESHSISMPAEPPRSPARAPRMEPPDIPSAEQQSELLLLQAQMKVSEIEKEAYEKGFAQGQKAGVEVGEKMVESLLKQYSASLEELQKLRKEVFASSEREVIRLALEVAKKIIKREIAIDEELILTLVKVALSRVSDQELITIRVNPRDHHTIERHRAAQSDSALSQTVKLIEDPLIGRGGCIIETDSGTIDARIEEQLREVEKGFFE